MPFVVLVRTLPCIFFRWFSLLQQQEPQGAPPSLTMATAQQLAMPSPPRGSDPLGGGIGNKSGASPATPPPPPPQQQLGAGSAAAGGGSGGSSQAGAVEAAVEFWSKTFNLEARKAALDQQGLALSEAKEATQRARKKLAEYTREFKRKSEAEKLTNFDELLKSYQEEIDNLTRRARASDAAFHCVYKDLYSAPDPAPLLASLPAERSRCATLELELGRLAREVTEYEAEFLKLRNQDVTIRKLEAKISEYELSMEAQVADELEQARAEVEEVAEARVREAVEREKRMEDKAKAAEAARDEAEAGRQRAQTQVVEATRQAEERAAAAQAEYELLAETSERHQAQAAAARREADALLKRLQQLQQQQQANNSSGEDEEAGVGGPAPQARAAVMTELEKEKGELTVALGALRQRLVAKEEEWGRAAEQWGQESGRLQLELERERADKAALQAEMAARPSKEEVEELRAKVRLLQQLEYNVLPTGDDDDDDGVRSQHRGAKGRAVTPASTDGEAPANPEETGGQQQSVEQILLGRIRRLETEVMGGRRKLAEALADRAKLQESLQASESRAGELQALVGRLEEDLSHLSAPPPPTTSKQQPLDPQWASAGTTSDDSHSAKEAAVAASDPSSSEQSAEVDMTELLASTSTSTSTSRAHHAPSLDLSVTTRGLGPSSSSGEAAGGGVDLTKILQAQRDRYRERLRLVEGENEALVREAGRSKAALEGLQRDNLHLYEKIRFLQTCFSKSNANAATQHHHPAPHLRHSAGHQHDGGLGVLEDGGGGGHVAMGGGEARYRALYEEQMNPFTQFSNAERHRRYTELSVAEKITLATTRFFLQNKAARSFVFFYALGLHALVFLTVFLWSAHHCDDLKRAVPLDHHHHPMLPLLPPEGPASALGAAAGGAVASALTGRRR